MNANNLLRLRKEARVVLPFWAASATWIIAPFLLRANDAMAISLAGLLFGYATIGPVCVGHEFARGTMGVLLAQPVLRRRLWWEKLAVTSAALLSLSLLFVDRAIQAGTSWRLFFHELAGADLWHVALFIAVIILVPLLGIGTVGAAHRHPFDDLALVWLVGEKTQCIGRREFLPDEGLVGFHDLAHALFDQIQYFDGEGAHSAL